jgi:hypothetical protein
MIAIADALRDYSRAGDLQMPARPADIWAVVAAGARVEWARRGSHRKGRRGRARAPSWRIGLGESVFGRRKRTSGQPDTKPLLAEGPLSRLFPRFGLGPLSAEAVQKGGVASVTPRA